MANLSGISVGALDPSVPTQREIEESPWKYRGYKDFASYMASDSDFFAVRRFGRLHTRAIITLQDHLAELEGKLDAIDRYYSLKTTKAFGTSPPVAINVVTFEKCSQADRNASAGAGEGLTGPRDINNGTIRDDMPERTELISQIAAKLAEYDRLLLDYCSLRGLTKAPKRNIENIKSWLECNSGAIMEEEAKFIDQADDLVSGCAEKSKLRGLFENQIVLRTKTFLGLFRKQPPSSMSLYDQNEVYHFSDEAIDTFGSIAVLATALTMLVAPLWILQALQDIRWKLVVITFFVVICLLFLSFGTLVRPFERLAATAGYSAVLVVFLQLHP